MMDFILTILLIALFGVFIVVPFLLLVCKLLEILSSLFGRN